MNYHTKAVYRGGTFVPETQCDLPEEATVDLLVQGPLHVSPAITDSEQRDRVLRRITARMKRNPISPEALRLTRDELHERR